LKHVHIPLLKKVKLNTQSSKEFFFTRLIKVFFTKLMIRQILEKLA